MVLERDRALSVFGLELFSLHFFFLPKNGGTILIVFIGAWFHLEW